jgi:hypothetical protein
MPTTSTTAQETRSFVTREQNEPIQYKRFKVAVNRWQSSLIYILFNLARQKYRFSCVIITHPTEQDIFIGYRPGRWGNVPLCSHVQILSDVYSSSFPLSGRRLNWSTHLPIKCDISRYFMSPSCFDGIVHAFRLFLRYWSQTGSHDNQN